jgi:hypothetical protein
VRLARERHLPLLHRLEQRRLHLGRSAVDLVGEHEVGEDRPRRTTTPRCLRVEDLRADEIRRQQVGGELHAAELGPDRPGQARYRERLGEAGQPFEQHVPVGEQRDQEPIHHFALAYEHAAEVLANIAQKGALFANAIGQS